MYIATYYMYVHISLVQYTFQLGLNTNIIHKTYLNVIICHLFFLYQEKPYQGKASQNQLVGAQYHLLVNNHSGCSGSSGSNGSAAATAWDRSRSSSQRLSINSTRNSSNSNASNNIYYPGQRHPNMLPGDEAL